MKYSSLLLSSAFLASSVSYADYQIEFDAGLSTGSGTIERDYVFFEDEIDYDVSGSNFGATVYIGSVSTNSVPLREAGFWSKKSYVSFDVSTYKESASGFEDYDVKAQGLSGRFVLPNTNVFLGGGVASSDLDGEDGDNLYVEGGVYLTDSNALWFTYDRGDVGDDTDSASFLVNYSHIHGLSGEKHVAWGVAVEKSKFETNGDTFQDSLRLEGSGTFYFNNQFGIGLTVDLTATDYDDGDEGASSTFMPHVTYDFNDNVGLTLITTSSATIIEFDDGDEYRDSSVVYTFGLNARF